MRTLGLAGLLLLAAPPSAVPQGKYRPDERVIISDFSVVYAVAASRTAVYGATSEGLIIYDRRFGRWQPPVTRADGYPSQPVNRALIDPADESLWLASDAGLLHYQPQLRQLEPIATGGVTDILFDRDDPIRGLFLRTERGGWELLPRGALNTLPAMDLPPAARRVQAASLESVLRRHPAAEAMGATSLLNQRLRRYSYTSAAIAQGDGEVFFGTDGLGLFRMDPLAGRLEPLPFGLHGSRVAAVELIPGGGWVTGGAWVATTGPDVPLGFARVTEDLQVAQYEPEGAATPVFREVNDLLTRGPEVWAATERGIARFAPGFPSRITDAAAGLPGDRVLALANAPAGVWVGTDRGLALARTDGPVTIVGQGRAPVTALLTANDSVWVGTMNGLRYGQPASTDLIIPDDVAAEPALGAPITALARNVDTVIVATPERIVWKGPRGTWLAERPLIEIGELRALAADRAGVWIGGSRGLAFFRFTGRSFVTFNSGEDLPGGVTGIVVAGPYLWVGTERGLVRVARRALVP